MEGFFLIRVSSILKLLNPAYNGNLFSVLDVFEKFSIYYIWHLLRSNCSGMAEVFLYNPAKQLRIWNCSSNCKVFIS